MSEIRNFDELAQDTTFTFKGEKFIIPSITNKKALKLFSIGKKAKKDDKQIPLIESDNLNENSEDDSSEEFVDFQNKYICAAVVKEDGSPVTEEDLETWPMKVSMAVVKLINECIQGVSEDTAEEKK